MKQLGIDAAMADPLLLGATLGDLSTLVDMACST